jgi:membrane protease YdiL (CAAX protease family)
MSQPIVDVGPRPSPRAQAPWGSLLLGLAIVFVLFQGLAHALGSERGEAGLLVAAVVVAALVAVERIFFGQSATPALRSLGFGLPTISGLSVALAVSALLVAVIPIYAWMRGAAIVPYPGWPWLVPGLFAQGGVAEETLFRGYLFGRLRRDRSFWPAAGLAAVPFVLVHLYLFATMPWPVALASVVLATIISFPLSHLFELGGSTIWPSAVLHCIVQGAVKVLEAPGDALMPIVWIMASAAIPYLSFCFGAQEPAEVDSLAN